MIITRNAVFLFWHLSFIVSTSKNASTREISKPTAAKQQRQGLRTGNNFPSASLASVVTCIATNAPIPLCLTVKDSRNKVKKERRKLRKTPDPLFFLADDDREDSTLTEMKESSMDRFFSLLLAPKNRSGVQDVLFASCVSNGTTGLNRGKWNNVSN